MELIKLIKKIVHIQSNYPLENQLFRYFKTFFSIKYKTTSQKIEDNRSNLLVQKGKGKKSILLYSHLDTVGISNGWLTDPFKLTIKGDKAYGLGAWDMKAGMAANILAFQNFQPKNYNLKMVFCVDEENISKGGHVLIKSPFMKDVQCVLSPEPAFNYGNNGIVTGRIGRAVYDIEIQGESKHFAFYESKYDINKFVGELLISLNEINHDDTPQQKQFVFARKIQSEAIGMSIPQKTNIQLDSSVLPPNTHKKILNTIKTITKKLNKKYHNYFKISVNFFKRETPFLEPYEINQHNNYLKILSQSVYEITGKKAVPYFRSSVADENIFGSHGYTVLGIGPKGGNAHAPNEWVSLSSLETLYNILINFLKQVDNDLSFR